MGEAAGDGKRILPIQSCAVMPEHIRALVVLLVLATPVWWIAQNAFSNLLPSSTFSRWRNLWFLLTLALFLSHNYWLYAFLLIAMVMAARRQESQVVGLYFVLLFAGSPVPIQVPGFGLINYVLVIDYYRLLTLTLFLPTALVLIKNRQSVAYGKGPADYLVLAYFLLASGLAFRDTSITNGARGVFTHVIEILLPYYVVSRSIRDVEGFKTALSGFVIAACLLAPVSVFESVRGWRLYTSVHAPLGLNPLVWSQYLGRAGLLRAAASLGHPIVLGFAFMVALGFMLFLSRSIAKRWQRWLAWSSLVLGLLSTLSRGPWVGAILLGLAFVLTAGKSLQNLLKTGLLIALGFFVLSAFSIGQKLLNLLPFWGTEEAGSVDYRVELWSFVWPVVERNYWLGSTNYLMSPELRSLAAIQGQGIADLVNHYFEIVLAYGVIGLALFCGIFLRTLYSVWYGMQRKSSSQEQKVLGAALFCTLLSILITLATASGVVAIPAILWSALGVCMAYSVMVRESTKQRAASLKRGNYSVSIVNK